jgi:predicted DNA-binding ribbon-helix-helix protein
VNKEVEQNLNNSFNDIENKIIEEKKIFDLNKDSILENNIEKKLNLLNDIKILIEKETDSVKGWQKKINDFDKLKHNIEITGPIPKKSKKTFWNDYKKIVRTFYSEKNSFFKRLKKIYSENLEKQKNLIDQVDNIHKEENLENFRSQVISIQKNWKLIKPVPYKANEKNWKLFKSTCDEYFQKLIHKKDNYSKEKNESNKKQKVIIENLNDFSGNEEDLVIVAKEFLSFKNISTENETKFYKKIKKILKDLGLNSKNIDDKISDIKSKLMSSEQKNTEIQNINSKLELLSKELTQQENNLSFFNEKSKENKILNKVHEKIKKNKKEIDLLKNHKKKLLS